MGGTLRTVLVAFCLLSRAAIATDTHLIAREETTQPSAAKSIVYGAVLGTIVAASATLVDVNRSVFLFAYFIGAGSAGGLGYYLLHSSASPPRETSSLQVEKVAPGARGVSANLLSWDF